MSARRSEMAVEIANQEKRKEQLMETFQNYDQQQSMFQESFLRMLRGQENIIHKQRETKEKKTATNKIKTKTYKNNRSTRKKGNN